MGRFSKNWVNQRLQHEHRLELGQIRTKAVVHSLPERDVLSGVRTVDVELVGMVSQPPPPMSNPAPPAMPQQPGMPAPPTMPGH